MQHQQRVGDSRCQLRRQVGQLKQIDPARLLRQWCQRCARSSAARRRKAWFGKEPVAIGLVRTQHTRPRTRPRLLTASGNRASGRWFRLITAMAMQPLRQLSRRADHSSIQSKR